MKKDSIDFSAIEGILDSEIESLNKLGKNEKSNKTLEDTLKKMATEGLIVPRTENNKYLCLSYKGAGGLVSNKWNIKIYTTGNFVCNDPSIIRKYYHKRLKPPDKSLKLIQIDDSGIGFPLGGCMVGVCCGDKVYTDTVDVSFFKPGPFERKEYLIAYTNRGLNLMKKELNPTPETHRFEICSGFINKVLRDLLNLRKFDVEMVEVKGLLQDQLENKFKDHIKELTGVDLAYDPKEITTEQVAFRYDEALAWAIEHAPHLLKSGWQSMKNQNIK